jgi:hypothetical protein
MLAYKEAMEVECMYVHGRGRAANTTTTQKNRNRNTPTPLIQEQPRGILNIFLPVYL